VSPTDKQNDNPKKAFIDLDLLNKRTSKLVKSPSSLGMVPDKVLSSVESKKTMGKKSSESNRQAKCQPKKDNHRFRCTQIETSQACQVTELTGNGSGQVIAICGIKKDNGEKVE
jgi:hypothetical protein